MTVQIVVIVVAIAAAMIWWYLIKSLSQKKLAKFKAETEHFQGSILQRAQEKLSQAELALSTDKSQENQQAYNEAVYELNTIKSMG